MKNKIEALRADIEAALAEVAKKHGLQSIKAGKASYTDSTVEFKLMCLDQGGDSIDAQRYNLMSKMLNLPPLGTSITSKGIGYTAIGINSTGSKIHATHSGNGKTYLFATDSFVNAAIGQGKHTVAAAQPGTLTMVPVPNAKAA